MPAEPVMPPDPVIETRLEVREICPAELAAPLPAMLEPGAAAMIQGNEAGMRWLAAVLEQLAFARSRFDDARSACPQ
ncbi:MAG: hypothetical protein R3E02_10000 [Blastomonas sp.]